MPERAGGPSLLLGPIIFLWYTQPPWIPPSPLTRWLLKGMLGPFKPQGLSINWLALYPSLSNALPISLSIELLICLSAYLCICLTLHSSSPSPFSSSLILAHHHLSPQALSSTL